MFHLVRILGSLAILVALFISLAIMYRSRNHEPNPCGDMLIVTRYDTLNSIAARCSVSIGTIYDLNPRLVSSNVQVQSGMVLVLSADANIEDAADAIFPDIRATTP